MRAHGPRISNTTARRDTYGKNKPRHNFLAGDSELVGQESATDGREAPIDAAAVREREPCHATLT